MDRYYLHNDYSIIAEFFTKEILVGLGQLEHDAIKRCPAFLYEVRNVSLGAIERETLAHVADVHDFCTKLWFLGDIYLGLEQCFCIGRTVVHKHFAGYFSSAGGRVSATTLSLDDLRKIRPFLSTDKGQEFIRAIEGGDLQTTSFSKRGNRLERAFSFVCAARSTIQLHLKIVFYCSGLECLFSTQSSELSHQIAERASWYCVKDPEARLTTYRLVKRAYSMRSKIVHGSTLTDADQTKNVEIAEQIDDLTGDNLKGWSGYASKNSYHPDTAKLKHDLGGEGAKADLNAKYDGDWKEWKGEGRCYATPINVAADTFTGKGGKRD